MSTKTMKILTFLVTVLLVISMGASVVLATTDGTITPDKLTGTPLTGSEISNFGNKIIGILQAVGIVLSVVILVILGIKYMMGSAEEKADYKKTMMPYLVGALFIFLAPTIANMVYQFLKNE